MCSWSVNWIQAYNVREEMFRWGDMCRALHVANLYSSDTASWSCVSDEGVVASSPNAAMKERVRSSRTTVLAFNDVPHEFWCSGR